MALRQLSACPFELGTSFRGTDDGTATGNLINAEILGGVWTFNNIVSVSPTGGVRKFHTDEPLVCMAVRNQSGVTAYGKRFVTAPLTTAGLTGITDFNGYCDSLAEGAIGVIDEFLSSSGVASKDICWVIISGVVTTSTPETGAAFNGDIAAGAELVAATAASSTGSATGGRVSNVVFTAATAGNTSNGFDGYRMALNRLGTALSARTTGETSADLLMRVRVSRLL